MAGGTRTRPPGRRRSRRASSGRAARARLDPADFATVLAIAGGLGAAICWAASSMGSARAARLIGSWATLGWVMLIGTAIAVPATILGGAGAELNANALTLLAIS